MAIFCNRGGALPNAQPFSAPLSISIVMLVFIKDTLSVLHRITSSLSLLSSTEHPPLNVLLSSTLYPPHVLHVFLSMPPFYALRYKLCFSQAFLKAHLSITSTEQLPEPSQPQASTQITADPDASHLNPQHPHKQQLMLSLATSTWRTCTGPPPKGARSVPLLFPHMRHMPAGTMCHHNVATCSEGSGQAELRIHACAPQALRRSSELARAELLMLSCALTWNLCPGQAVHMLPRAARGLQRLSCR